MKKVRMGRDAIVLALADAYDTVENTGSKLAAVCQIARDAYNGKPVPDDDAEYIASKLAETRGWEGNTAKVRKSEARKVLEVYTVLPDAIAHVKAKRGACNWRDALKLSTCLKKNDGKLKPAIAAFEEAGESTGSTPPGRVASALKGWYKVAKGDKRQKILEAATLLNLKLGIKLDA